MYAESWRRTYYRSRLSEFPMNFNKQTEEVTFASIKFDVQTTYSWYSANQPKPEIPFL